MVERMPPVIAQAPPPLIMGDQYQSHLKMIRLYRLGSDFDAARLGLKRLNVHRLSGDPGHNRKIGVDIFQ